MKNKFPLMAATLSMFIWIIGSIIIITVFLSLFACVSVEECREVCEPGMACRSVCREEW
jgi:hypothetical protein